MAEELQERQELSWNEGLEPIEPLIEYYAREMGQLAGRLMTALSFMVDLEDSYGWDQQSRQVRESVHYSRLLVASVLRIVAAAQVEQGDELGMAEAIQEMLNRLAEGKNGEAGQFPGGVRHDVGSDHPE